ncbi:N-acetylglucosamine kinase [Virgibacillus siamensis]|uniref:N-acetylglucosamine kinase n=1 Tax=Virgibacillus siamensis TaxID=480071 RepID=A0ABP3QFR3_9BACI
MNSYVIGIDGGGTKTEAVLADDCGNIITTVKVGPTNPNAISEIKLLQTFEELFNQLKDRTSVCFKKVTTIFAGISGAASKESSQQIYQIISRCVPSWISIHIEPDSINALYSGTYGKPGIVQICGTGSITYGMNDNMVHGRVGGWGHLFGDEGSGYDIGKQGISAALEYFDGRGLETVLLHKFYNEYQAENGREIIERIYKSSNSKQIISAASKIVFNAFKEDDIVSKQIILGVSNQIVNNIQTLRKQLFDGCYGNIEVILCGGVFNDQTVLLPIVRRKLFASDINLSVIAPKLPPVGGAVAGAFMKSGKELNSKVIERFINGMK